MGARAAGFRATDPPAVSLAPRLARAALLADTVPGGNDRRIARSTSCHAFRPLDNRIMGSRPMLAFGLDRAPAGFFVTVIAPPEHPEDDEVIVVDRDGLTAGACLTLLEVWLPPAGHEVCGRPRAHRPRHRPPARSARLLHRRLA